MGDVYMGVSTAGSLPANVVFEDGTICTVHNRPGGGRGAVKFSALAVDASGERVLTSDVQGVLTLHDLAQQGYRRVRDMRVAATRLAFCVRDGGLAIAVLADATIRVYDLDSGDVVATLGGHKGDVLAVAQTADGGTLLTASADVALLWSTADWSRKRALGYAAGVAGAATAAAAPLVGLAFRNDTVCVWDAVTFALVAKLRLPEAEAGAGLCSLALADDGSLALAAGSNGCVYVWDLPTSALVRIVDAPPPARAVLQVGVVSAATAAAQASALLAASTLAGSSASAGTRALLSQSAAFGLAPPSVLMLDDSGRLLQVELGSRMCAAVLELEAPPPGPPAPGSAPLSPSAPASARLASFALSADGRLLACTTDDGRWIAFDVPQARLFRLEQLAAAAAAAGTVAEGTVTVESGAPLQEESGGGHGTGRGSHDSNEDAGAPGATARDDAVLPSAQLSVEATSRLGEAQVFDASALASTAASKSSSLLPLSQPRYSAEAGSEPAAAAGGNVAPPSSQQQSGWGSGSVGSANEDDDVLENGPLAEVDGDEDARDALSYSGGADDASPSPRYDASAPGRGRGAWAQVSPPEEGEWEGPHSGAGVTAADLSSTGTGALPLLAATAALEEPIAAPLRRAAAPPVLAGSPVGSPLTRESVSRPPIAAGLRRSPRHAVASPRTASYEAAAAAAAAASGRRTLQPAPAGVDRLEARAVAVALVGGSGSGGASRAAPFAAASAPAARPGPAPSAASAAPRARGATGVAVGAQAGAPQVGLGGAHLRSPHRGATSPSRVPEHTLRTAQRGGQPASTALPAPAAPPTPLAPAAPPSAPLHELLAARLAVSPGGEAAAAATHRRLAALLASEGSFPSRYRSLAWRFLLRLPGNTDAAALLAARGAHPAWADLPSRFPVHDARLLARLARTLNTLAHWSPVLGTLPFLPVLAFPFVKAAGSGVAGGCGPREELAALETIMCVLLNWGRSWASALPLPPVPLLAAASAVLAHWDPRLAAALERSGVDGVCAIWPLLRSAFSEVLPRSDWECLWDALFVRAGDATLLAYAACAYLRTHRGALLVIAGAPEGPHAHPGAHPNEGFGGEDGPFGGGSPRTQAAPLAPAVPSGGGRPLLLHAPAAHCAPLLARGAAWGDTAPPAGSAAAAVGAFLRHQSPTAMRPLLAMVTHMRAHTPAALHVSLEANTLLEPPRSLGGEGFDGPRHALPATHYPPFLAPSSYLVDSAAAARRRIADEEAELLARRRDGALLREQVEHLRAEHAELRAARAADVRAVSDAAHGTDAASRARAAAGVMIDADLARVRTASLLELTAAARTGIAGQRATLLGARSADELRALAAARDRALVGGGGAMPVQGGVSLEDEAVQLAADCVAALEAETVADTRRLSHEEQLQKAPARPDVRGAVEQPQEMPSAAAAFAPDVVQLIVSAAAEAAVVAVSQRWPDRVGGDAPPSSLASTAAGHSRVSSPARVLRASSPARVPVDDSTQLQASSADAAAAQGASLRALSLRDVQAFRERLRASSGALRASQLQLQRGVGGGPQ